VITTPVTTAPAIVTPVTTAPAIVTPVTHTPVTSAPVTHTPVTAAPAIAAQVRDEPAEDLPRAHIPLARAAAPRETKKTKSKYTREDIALMLTGYVKIHRAQWDSLLHGARIRYFCKGDEPKEMRFYKGGFVREIKDGVMYLGAQVSGNLLYNVPMREVEEIWKEYGQMCAIELLELRTMIERQNRTIAELTARVPK
jgi:hypothetical protein